MEIDVSAVAATVSAALFVYLGKMVIVIQTRVAVLESKEIQSKKDIDELLKGQRRIELLLKGFAMKRRRDDHSDDPSDTRNELIGVN